MHYPQEYNYNHDQLYLKNGQTKQVKYKHAEKMIAQGEWLITEHN